MMHILTEEQQVWGFWIGQGGVIPTRYKFNLNGQFLRDGREVGGCLFGQ